MGTCGTRVGYQRHQDEAGQPCPSCLAANSNAVKASRVRTGKQRSLNIPVHVLRETLAAHDCTALRAFLGEKITEAIRQAP